jgi:gas vesicle protein
MSAEQILKYLMENSTEDTIQSIQEELRARVAQTIEESRKNVMSGLGFISEEKDEDEEDMDEEEEESEEKEDE